MPTARSPMTKIFLAASLGGALALGSFGLYSVGGFDALNNTAATAGSAPTSTSSSTDSPSAEPTPEPTTPAQKMERTAQEAFGADGAQATSKVQQPFPLSDDAAQVLVQQFKGGVVMYTPTYGAVAVHPNVYEHWWRLREYSEFADSEGLPKSWRVENGTLYTAFEKVEIYWDAPQALPRSTEQLGPKDALVIGDSQVTPTSWVGLGLKKAGFTPHMFRCGGVGFVADRDGDCPSYYQGVMSGRWALPGGSPEIIYLDASGNDIHTSENETNVREQTIAHQVQVIRKLQSMYPTAKIVFGGVVSMTESDDPDTLKARRRHEANDIAKITARQTGALFMDTSGWLTLYLEHSDIADGLHLKEKSQYKLATPFANRLRELLSTTTKSPTESSTQPATDTSTQATSQASTQATTEVSTQAGT